MFAVLPGTYRMSLFLEPIVKDESISSSNQNGASQLRKQVKAGFQRRSADGVKATRQH
jgi:hypothetical protein